MCREIIFWFMECFNFSALFFWGARLFFDIYNLYGKRKKYNFILIIIAIFIGIICISNYKYANYSNALTYFLIISMYITIKIMSKGKCKNSFSLIIIYVHLMRLVDLLVIAIVLQINHISRYFDWDFVHIGKDRCLFLLMLSLTYYWCYYFVRNNSSFIKYLIENKVYRWIVCLYTYVGIICFCRVYRFKYTNEIIQYWTFYLVCAFILFGYFIFYFVKIQSEEKNRILNMRNDLLESNYLSLQKVYDKNSMLYHDFKNHMLAVIQLIHNEEYKAAECYIQSYMEGITFTKSKVESGCRIIDIILNSKISEAKDKNIEFNYKIEYIGNISIEDIDICSLLANLLDNAIEACENIQNKIIEINIKRNKDMLIIKLSNSIDENMKNKQAFFETDKEDKLFHGWGIKSIENVVKKYEGYKEYEIKINKLNVFISLPLD